jgi:NAD(P)-dependent dehydrogenase (short-subunit alcohol dehydrogenase family)
VIDIVVARTQIGRLIQPEEIARVVANVISDDVVTRDVQADGGYYEPA